MCSACIQKRCTVFLRQYIVNRYFHTLPINKFKYFFVTHFSCIFKFVKFFGKFRIVFINKQADYVHFFFVGPAEHCAPGVHRHGIAVGNVRGVLIPGGGDAYGEALIVHGPLPEEQFPVSGACGHVERRRDKEHFRPPQTHAAGQFLKPQVKADAKTAGAEFRLKGGDGISWGEGVRLPKGLAAFHVNVKEMDLPVAGQELTVPSVNKTGVVDVSLRQFWNGPAHNVEPKLRRQVGEGLLDLSAFRLAIGPETAVFIGAAEHLRQYGDVRARLLGGPDLFTGGAEIGGFICCYPHLNQCNTHRISLQTPVNAGVQATGTGVFDGFYYNTGGRRGQCRRDQSVVENFPGICTD